MSRKFYPLIALGLYASLLVGCAAGVDLNKVQPPPRTDLEQPLDLYESVYTINNQTLAKMRAQGLDDGIVSALNEKLAGQEFTNSQTFRQSLEEAVPGISNDDAQVVMFSSLIERLVAVTAPAGALSLTKAQERQKAGLTRVSREVEQARTLGFQEVLFDFDRYDIKVEYSSTIRSNARLLIENPNITVTIEGHCDERGSNQYNLALGERRASAVRRAMIAQGAAAGQIRTISYGEERPAAVGSNEEAWSQNRRAVYAVGN